MPIKAIIILVGIVATVMLTEYYFTKKFREENEKNKKKLKIRLKSIDRKTINRLYFFE